jgi:hypothetical protein
MALNFDTLREKANEIKNEIRLKMNSAVRVGSLFLELVEKITEGFSLVTSESTARAAADTAIKNAVDIYNVTQQVPLSSGYYTPSAARAAVPAAIRKDGLIITYQVSAASWNADMFFQGELTDWTTAANWRAVDGPDLLLATTMADLYEKLNNSDWWLNGHGLNEKTLIRNIRCTQAPFTGTLIVTRSAYITQYLIGPAILLDDNTFDEATYYESYILKRTYLSSSNPGQWHYVDRPDFINIDAYKPLAEGYYTPATARNALPASARKTGLVITYQTGANKWNTEQYTGSTTSDWTSDEKWEKIGTDYSATLSNINDALSGLQKTTFKYLPPDTDLDTITDLGAYYIGTEEVASTGGIISPSFNKEKTFLFVVGEKTTMISTTKTNDVTQYKISSDGMYFRKHYPSYGYVGDLSPASWDDWTGVSGGIEEAPGDGKTYGRKNAEWVEAADTRIVILPAEDYEDLEEKDPDTLYFIT